MENEIAQRPEVELNTQQYECIRKEASQFLNNVSGNNGRVIRRFLKRVTVNGKIRQVFTQGFSYARGQLNAIEAHAQKLAADLVEDGMDTETVIQFISTVRDEPSRQIYNNFYIGLDIQTASVSTMRMVLYWIVRMCDQMTKFAKDPNSVFVFAKDKDYIYRGYPINVSEEGWHVGGDDRRDGGGGVLEWCESEEDAKDRLTKMKKHFRFQNLSVSTHNQ